MFTLRAVFPVFGMVANAVCLRYNGTQHAVAQLLCIIITSDIVQYTGATHIVCDRCEYVLEDRCPASALYACLKGLPEIILRECVISGGVQSRHHWSPTSSPPPELPELFRNNVQPFMCTSDREDRMAPSERRRQARRMTLKLG